VDDADGSVWVVETFAAGLGAGRAPGVTTGLE
jgi:hypothetical protein